MINLGQLNYNDATQPNTIFKQTGPGSNPSINTIGPSLLTDDGTTLKYKGVSLSNGGSAPIAPSVIYSAAGTPLPAASNALKGARAIVSDATTPTYLGAYVSGGAVLAGVICTGSGWVTG